MMPAASSPKENAGPGQHALIYAGMGWRVLPIKPGEKRPPMSSWQHAASTDHKVIVNWFKGLYQNHGCGIATGEESGLWVLDIDVGEGKAGVESLAELEQRYGPLPVTVEAVTGSGGRHLYFTWPPGRRVVTRRDTGATDSPLPAGIDVRGEGGQVLAPPTIHPNGSVYRWRDGCAPWDREIVDAPGWLLAIVCEQDAPPAPAPATAPHSTPDGFLGVHDGPEDSIAGWWNQTKFWDELLLADGWTPLRPQGSQQYWVRPGKEARDGHSATLHLPDGPFVIFSTDGSLSKFALPEARVASGDGWAFSKFGYTAASRHGGDRSEAARRIREVRTEHERRGIEVGRADSTPDTPQVSIKQLRTGAEFILDEEPEMVALWGEGDNVIWSKGEPLYIVAPTGAGKTTVAVQLLAGMLGLQDELLGFPVADEGDKILYLAMDRPKQISRAMARLFNERARDVLRDRLVIWRGPLPHDLGKRPETLLELCQEVGASKVFVDSLKDAAVKLSDDEIGGNFNRAVQLCITADVDVCGLHHQRKRTNGGEKPKSIDDIYGSIWIPSGAGSIILLWGAAGSPLVEFVHLKQPANDVGPFIVEHDHYAGTSSVYRGFDPLVFLRNRGEYGATTTEAARAMLEKENVSDNERKKAQRILEGLVRRGFARKSDASVGGARDGQKGSEGARYFYVEGVLGSPDNVTGQGVGGDITDASPPSPDNQGKSPAQITGHVTGQHRTTRSPDTAPPFNRGAGDGKPSDEEEEDEWEAPF